MREWEWWLRACCRNNVFSVDKCLWLKLKGKIEYWSNSNCYRIVFSYHSYISTDYVCVVLLFCLFCLFVWLVGWLVVRLLVCSSFSFLSCWFLFICCRCCFGACFFFLLGGGGDKNNNHIVLVYLTCIMLHWTGLNNNASFNRTRKSVPSTKSKWTRWCCQKHYFCVCVSSIIEWFLLQLNHFLNRKVRSLFVRSWPPSLLIN